MRSSRPARAATKQQTYKESSSESELTELEDSDADIAMQTQMAPSSSRVTTTTRRTVKPSAKAQAMSSARVRGGRKTPQAVNRKGKRKADDDAAGSEKDDIIQEVNVARQKTVSQPSKIDKLLSHSTSALVNVDIHVSSY
jgi:hypothetical protein